MNSGPHYVTPIFRAATDDLRVIQIWQEVRVGEDGKALIGCDTSLGSTFEGMACASEMAGFGDDITCVPGYKDWRLCQFVEWNHSRNTRLSIFQSSFPLHAHPPSN